MITDREIWLKLKRVQEDLEMKAEALRRVAAQIETVAQNVNRAMSPLTPVAPTHSCTNGTNEDY